MPDPLKQLLVKLKLDNQEFKKTLNEIRSKLKESNDESLAAANKALTKAKELLAVGKQQITDQKLLSAQSKAMADFDKAKAAWQQQQAAAIKTKIAAASLETAEAKKQQTIAQAALRIEQDKLRIQSQQFRLQQQQTREAERQAKASKEGAAFPSLFGGGLVGKIATGAFISEGAVRLVEMATEKIKDLGREMVHALGPAQQLRDQFERLASRRGGDAAGLLDKLRQATRGLVSDYDLLRVANNFMKSGMKVTDDQMVKMVGTTVDLGRSMAKSSDEIIHSLERAFLNPTYGMRRLAYTTGINVRVLQQAMAGLPNTMDPLTKATITFNHVLAEEEKMLHRVGVPATTLPEVFKQLEVAQGNFAEGLARGLTGSTDYHQALEKIRTTLIALGPKLEEFAKTVGEKLANAFEWIIDNKDDILHLFEGIVGIKLIDWGLGSAAAIIELTKAFKGLAAVEGITQLLGATGAGKFVGALRKPAATVGVEAATGAAAGTAGAEAVAAGGVSAIAGIVTSVLIFLGLAAWIEHLKTKSDEEAKGQGAQRVITGYVRGQPIYGLGYTPEQIEARKQLDEWAAGKMGGTKRGRLEDQHPTEDQLKHTEQEEEEQAQQTLQLQQKLAKQREQITIMSAKMQLQVAEAAAKKEEDLNKVRYDSGIISLTAYTQKAEALRAADLGRSLAEINKETQAKLKSLHDTSQVEIDGTVYATKDKKDKANLEVIIRQQADLKIQAARTKAFQDEIRSDQSLLANQEAAYAGYVDTLKQISLRGVSERAKVTEKEFQMGMLSSADYISQRKMLMEEEYELTIQGLEDQKKARKDNAKEVENIERQILMAKADRIIKSIQLEQEEEQVGLKVEETRYSQAKKYLDVQAKIATQTIGVGRNQNQVEVAEALRDITAEHLKNLREILATQTAGTDNWIKTTEDIAQATEQQEQLNQQLVKMKDISAPLSGAFGKIGEILSQFKSVHIQGIAETFKNMQVSFEHLSKFSEGMARLRDSGGLLHSLSLPFLRGATGTATNVRQTAQQIFDQGLIQSKSKTDKLSEAMAELTQAVRGMTSAAKTEADRIRGGIEGKLGGGEGPKPRWSFQSGTAHVPETGPALLHEGEAVIPAGMNAALQMLVDSIQQAAQKITNAVVPVGGTSTSGDGKSSGGVVSNLVKDTHESGKKFTSKLNDFTNALGVAADGIMGFVSSITSAKSGGQGALQGGLSGMKLGAEFGGPVGAAIGAVVGGVTGGIFGAKEKQLQEDIHKIQGQMQSIVDSMNEGAITLSQAIADMRKEREAAIQLLSSDPKGGKGGGKGGKKGYNPTQAQAVIEQIDQQIAQLVNEQKQLLDQLNQQVAILSTPTAFQSYVQSLDQIIQKYQQFASAAAGNAQEVGNAQLFLNESLQQYVTTLGQQLNQAQQQAIQDGLTLLNLEYQRQQIINQEAQQEYDILTQGVLTRQRTTAMTKGQEIGQLRYQRDMQLQQMDEQIALQQYKVSTEQKIFDMATTRIGLEMQLLSLQEGQASFQSEQTAALLQVIQQLQAAMASGSLQNEITALGAGGAAPTGTGLLTTLLGALGLGGYVPPGVLTGPGGATNYLSQIPQPYQGITNFINNLDPNFLMNLWNAMQQPAGSGNRQSIIDEASEYASDAKTAGYDWNSFVNWMQSGSIVGTTATVTNAPVATGPQQLPSGTAFPMPVGTGYAPTSISTAPINTSQTPYQAVSGSMDDLTSSTTDAAMSMKQLSDNIQAVIAGISQGYKGTTVPVAVPSYDSGGFVGSTGIAQLQKGEFVVSNRHLVNLSAEGGLFDMAMKKAGVEMHVVSARSNLLKAEMEHLSMLNDTMDRISNISFGPAGSLEAMFQQVYETRGRFGSATFRRTNL